VRTVWWRTLFDAVLTPHSPLTDTVFHLAHCATQCAAPKLFAQLK
jgi:hypothetical protein